MWRAKPWVNTTLLASMVALRVWERAWRWKARRPESSFLKAYNIEKVLLLSLRRYEQVVVVVVVMDNLWAHKGERIRELIESTSCELLYLPAYF